MSTKPERYTWYDQYADVNPATTYQEFKQAAEMLAHVLKAAPVYAPNSTFPTVAAAYNTLESAYKKLDGYSNLQRETACYAERLAAWERENQPVEEDVTAANG